MASQEGCRRSECAHDLDVSRMRLGQHLAEISYQKTNLAANCMMRGLPAPRMVPKVETLIPLLGLLKFT